MMADIWLSLCTVTITGITETACEEMIVSEVLKLEYGCTPLHVTINTDYNPTSGKIMVRLLFLQASGQILSNTTKDTVHGLGIW
jgi:hypothetical protein